STSELPADVCRDRADLVAHFVMASAGLEPDVPVSASYVKAPFPTGAVPATLDGDPQTRELLHIGKQPAPGDIVNVKVFDANSGRYTATDVLVVSYTPGPPGRAQLKVPLDQADLEKR